MDKSILTRGVTRIESTSLPCSAAGLHNGQLQSVAFHVSSSNLFSDSLSFLFLKLGAGLGYASIVAARCGFSRVLATDGDVNLIPFTRSNAHDNAVSAIMRVEALSWNDTDTLEALVPSGMMTPDVIFASDVIYIGSSEAWGSFLTLVARLCRRRRNEMLAASSSSDAASSRMLTPRRCGLRLRLFHGTMALRRPPAIRSCCCHTRDVTRMRRRSSSVRRGSRGST